MTPGALDKKKILIVDDDRTFCAVLCAALRRRGHDCWIAYCIEEAVDEIAAWEPDYLCVDLRIGNESGIHLLQKARMGRPHLVVVMLTGYGSIATAVEATKLGAVQYLTKPVSAEDVLRAFDGRAPNLDVQAAPTTPLNLVEWEYLNRVLQESGGNVSEAARRLNMHRRTLQRKLARKRGV